MKQLNFKSRLIRRPTEDEMKYKLNSWVKVVCKAHKDLTGKEVLIVGYTPHKFYQCLYRTESVENYLKTGSYLMCDVYFGEKQIELIQNKTV